MLLGGDQDRGPASDSLPHRLEWVDVERCRLLERNPQYLTPKTMAALKRSIVRDGFTVPILVRPKGQHYEIVSGNHRFMAAKECGYLRVPAVVASLSDADAKRLAINLNLIHGNPQAEQLAPFLGDCPDEVLAEIHLERDLLEDIKRFDAEMAERLSAELPAKLDVDSPQNEQRTCKCQKCGRTHIMASSSTSAGLTSTSGPSEFSTADDTPPSSGGSLSPDAPPMAG